MTGIRCAVLVLALCSTAWANAFELPTAWNIRQLGLPTNDLVYDPRTGHLFASVTSAAGVGLGNTVTRIDPRSGAIVSSAFVGSEPGALALSSDGSVLYVGLNGSGAVRRFDMLTQTAGQQFQVGFDFFGGPLFAEDIAVMPGNPDVVAVSRRILFFSPGHEGVAVFENGIMRAKTTPGHTGSNRIEFSSDPAVLYGYNGETSEFGFRTMSVSAGGVSITNTVRNVISGFGVDIEYAGGLIYATSGRVIDPVNALLLGTYSSDGIVAPDPASGLIFFLSSFASQLTAYDQSTFVPRASYPIAGLIGTPSSLERWGDDGLAFRTSGGQVFLLTPVPEPGTWLLFGAGLLAIALRKRLA